MSYQPYLIANWATGISDRLQPWLLADDAQQQLYDGYVYRGVLSKREGYLYYAVGLRGAQPYQESRMVEEVVAQAMVGVIGGGNQNFSLNATTPVARGTFIITGTVPAQTFHDDGLGNILDSTNTIVGSIDYLTGVVTITTPTAPTAGTLTATYNYYPGDPVMMVASFYTTDNTRQLIVADTRRVNRYNSTLNILQDIGPAIPFTADNHNFFSWVNYQDANSLPRLLFCNGKDTDVIQQYDGTVPVINYAYTMEPVGGGAPITTLNALLMFEFKDRLVLLATIEEGTTFPRRIRISGTGANCDNFLTSAIGAGAIDIPDNTWISGAAFSRDDLMIFTEGSTWILRYTGNDAVPFVLDKIDNTRGCQAPFSAFAYLNRISAASPRGLIITDGYKVERQDDEIPDFSFNEIDGENFRLCFAGAVDDDRDHYLIYPSTNEEESDRILVTNYDEDNYAIYRQKLSCMGTYILSFDVLWDDLVGPKNPSWPVFGSNYGNWHSFGYAKGAPFSIGGGHNGEIWQLAVSEQEDNPVQIYNIVVVDDTTVQVTTDFNNFSINDLDSDQEGDLPADTIYITAVQGMLEINNQQFPVQEVIDPYTFNLTVPDSSIFSAFDATNITGSAKRVIPFNALTKKFNPFTAGDKKVRCGWLYMYVDSTGTILTRNVAIENIDLSDPLAVIVTTSTDNLFQTGDQISFFGIGGTTELNDLTFEVTVLTDQSFLLNGLDATGFGAYISGGYATIPETAKLSIQIITDDNQQPTSPNFPYEGPCTDMTFENNAKRWYKVFINQVGKFIQFRFTNTQAGAQIKIQAMMPGFQPLGRLI